MYLAKQKYLLPLLALVLANTLWGMNTFLIKMGLESIPVPIFIAIRFLTASLFILPFAIRSWKPLKRKDFLLLLLSSIFYITLSVTALNIGLSKTTASNAAIIWLLMPILLFLLSASFLREKLSLKTFLGITVALAGSLLIISKPWDAASGSAALTGNLLIVIAVFCNAISTIICKPLSKNIGSYQMTFMNFFPGILPIAIYACTKLGTWNIGATTTRSLTALVVSTVAVVIANFLFFYALRYKQVQSVGTYQYIDPLVTVAGAWVFLSERPIPTFYIGAVLVLIGVYIVETKMRLQKERI
ncbi:MAG TPA: DMT family transporter [Candidatus Saccharimonadales bacterium]